MKYIVLLLFYFIPIVSGYTGIFSILDEQYIENISELPYSVGIPEKIIQSSGHIHGWVDIAGFRDVVRYNGIDYINGNPADKAIIQYDAWGVDVSVDSVTKTTAVYVSENNVVAQMSVTLRWHYYYSCNCKKDKKGKESCSTCRKDVTEYAMFTDSEISPSLYPSLQSGSAAITEYNNTFNPKTAISLNLPGNISKATYRYANDTLAHYFKQGHVEQTAKGVYFMNLSKRDFWTSDTKSLQHLQTWVMIPNTAKPDYSNLTIEISSPYETMEIIKDNYSVERITYNSESTFSNPLLMFVCIIFTFTIISIIVIRRV